MTDAGDNIPLASSYSIHELAARQMIRITNFRTPFKGGLYEFAVFANICGFALFNKKI